jgi:hypothetical protein
MKVDTAPVVPGGDPLAEAAAPTARAWNVPDRFVVLPGHRQLLATVRRTLRAGRRALLCPVEDRVGTGATTAMVEFAHRNARDYEVAWWVRAVDPELVPDQLAALGEALGVADSGDAETTAARALHSLRHRDRYLIVFEDAATPHQLARFLPTGPGDTVIISSDPAWREYATAHPVGPFTRPESVALLRARRPDLPVDAAARVAAALDDVPLAVDPAAALLAETGAYVEQFPSLLSERSRQGGTPNPVVAVWGVVFDHLATNDPAALALLTLVAWLAPEPVPLRLLPACPPEPRALADAAQDPAALARSTDVLRRCGAVRITSGEIALHRVPAALLVARTAGERLGDTADGWAAAVIRLLQAGVPADPDDPAGREAWRRLLPLVLTATDPARHLDAVAADAGRLLRRAASYLRVRGHDYTAATLSRDADGLCAGGSLPPEERLATRRPPRTRATTPGGSGTA